MIYEYALEPELFFDWARSRRDYGHYITMFGHGTPRFLSSFPKNKLAKWRSYVWSKAPLDLGEIERQRVDELLQAISGSRIERDGYDFSDDSWLRSALAEHEKRPFEGIFVREKAAEATAACFSAEDTHGRDCALWHKKTMLTPARTADSLADAIANLLRLSKKVVVVDPYAFRGNAINSYKAFIARMVSGRIGSARPELMIMFDADKAQSRFVYDQLSGFCSDIDLKVIGLKERYGAEKLHNRYVLTELGGVSFGVGTDEGDPGQTDDLALLDADSQRLRWSQYVDHPVFDFLDVFPPR